MKKITLCFLIVSCFLYSSCHKASSSTTTVTEAQVLTDFVQKTALPQYQEMHAKATTLNNAIITLNATPTNDNFLAARQAWRDTRAVWENCEGFLFGPVEDNNFDPNMDTWPVDYLQLDSLIASNTTLNVATIQNLNQSLRGFHPLEFILWGKNGSATADSLSNRQKQYMMALSQDILNTVDSLNNSWAASGGNFQQQILQAGVASTRFTSKQEVFLAMVGALTDICEEVGSGKINEPFASYDSTKTESPFSHNSIIDFTNNIKGAQNVYLCTYNGAQGACLSNMVASKNLSLDNNIKEQFNIAIGTLNNISASFELSIYTQRTQLQNAMNALNTLQAILDGELKTFIMTNVKD